MKTVSLAWDSANDSLGSTVKDRLWSLLVEIAKTEGVPDTGGWTRVNRHVTHRELASMTGGSRPTISIYLGDLEKAKVYKYVERESFSIKIKEP